MTINPNARGYWASSSSGANSGQSGRQLQDYSSDHLVLAAGGWGAAEIGGALEALYAGGRFIARMFAEKPTVQFGDNPNQIFHTFQHVDELGLDRSEVATAIEQDIASNNGEKRANTTR